jgi:hypothetical protein
MPAGTPIICWGEEFPSYQALARDPRCLTTPPAFRRRLSNGMSPEDAAAFKGHGGPKAVTCWGETFPSLRALAADPRCVVRHVILSARLLSGMSPEEAASTTSRALVSKTWQCWGKKFSSMVEIANDPRCVVNSSTLKNRLTRGWPIMEATSRPMQVHRKPCRYICWGEKFSSLKNVADDVRCLVRSKTLHQRIRTGWPLEEAVSTPPCARRR